MLNIFDEQMVQFNIMFSFNSVLNSLKPSNIVSGISNNYQKLKQKISPPLSITEIVPNIYHCDFPQKYHHIGGSQFMIWNISQYPTEEQLSKSLKTKTGKGIFHHLNFQYYANLPFLQLLQAIEETSKFMAASSSNKIYLHCQEGKVRSAVFLASFLFITKTNSIQDISEAILFVNKKLGISLESSSLGYRCQHTLFKNLVNYHADKNFINKNCLGLQKIFITSPPLIKVKNGQRQQIPLWTELQAMIEVRCGPKVVFKTIYKGKIQGSIIVDLAAQGKNVIVGDQFLLIIKYIYQKDLYNVMRVQANTNFIFNKFARIHQHDADLSSFCQSQKTTSIIDINFREEMTHSGLSKLGQKVVKAPAKNFQSIDLLSGEGVTDSALYVPEQNFKWFEEEPDIDEHELSSKIEEVMKNMSKKEQQRGQDREEEPEQEDLDDYLSKLQAQTQGV